MDIGNGEKSKEADLEILTAGEDQSEVFDHDHRRKVSSGKTYGKSGWK